MSVPEKLEKVNVVLKANVYFGGKVVSHTVELADESKKTIGVVYPGNYNFNTGTPEKMEIVSGTCRAKVKGSEKWESYGAGAFFDVPGKSSFDIEVESGILEYLCSY